METEIIELEKEYWQAMEDRDFGTIKRLTRFPCLVAGKNGIRQVDETTFKTMFDSSEEIKGARNKVRRITSHSGTNCSYCLPDQNGICGHR
ncbi:MAG: hypothetical protein K0S24_1726 [Sphingobacterium sp.]|nr:hypothetical protein [Sphingobacterium sp.]